MKAATNFPPFRNRIQKREMRFNVPLQSVVTSIRRRSRLLFSTIETGSTVNASVITMEISGYVSARFCRVWENLSEISMPIDFAPLCCRYCKNPPAELPISRARHEYLLRFLHSTHRVSVIFGNLLAC